VKYRKAKNISLLETCLFINYASEHVGSNVLPPTAAPISATAIKIGILAKELGGWHVSAEASSGTASNDMVESRAAFRRSGQAIFCRGKF
jgi:hypothetical protein